MEAEETLCSKYAKYFPITSEKYFSKCLEYIAASRNHGRHPMGVGSWGFMFLLIAAESMGFSYLLGTWIATEGSVNLYMQLMYGIVFVLATILAYVTHEAGAEARCRRLLKSYYPSYTPPADTGFRHVVLNDEQSADSKDTAARRFIHRVAEYPNDSGPYRMSVVAGIFVALIFVASGVMRYYHMERELTLESQAVEATLSNPFAQFKMPSELSAPQAATDKKANSEVLASKKIEGGAAIFILGAIFVVTQVVGFNLGYKHSIVGEEAKSAYASTLGYSTYQDYWNAMKPAKAIVNERLKKLRAFLLRLFRRRTRWRRQE